MDTLIQYLPTSRGAENICCLVSKFLGPKLSYGVRRIIVLATLVLLRLLYLMSSGICLLIESVLSSWQNHVLWGLACCFVSCIVINSLIKLDPFIVWWLTDCMSIWLTVWPFWVWNVLSFTVWRLMDCLSIWLTVWPADRLTVRLSVGLISLWIILWNCLNFIIILILNCLTNYEVSCIMDTTDTNFLHPCKEGTFSDLPIANFKRSPQRS